MCKVIGSLSAGGTSFGKNMYGITGDAAIWNKGIPYTRVNKRMHLFAKLQGNMRLIPNMRLIAKGKLTTPLKLRCLR